MADACAEAERRLGHDARVVNIDVTTDETWQQTLDADVHVVHTHFPESVRAKITKPHAVVFVAHGTPEHVMENSIDGVETGQYAPSDGWMMLRHELRTADAVVTFWDRHRAIYQSMVPRERTIHCVPMGVDRAFWAAGTDRGRYAGTPSVWMSENQHRMKWALDTLIAWPWLTDLIPTARLHAHYIPNNIHRFFIDLANSNGAGYRSYLSATVYPHTELRCMWKSVDFFLGPVRYGDHNTLSMQAGAAGARVISYRGNPYADFWITEGDQRQIAVELAAIFRGDVPPRADKLPVPDLADMGHAMVAIYQGALDQARSRPFVPPPAPIPVRPAVTPAHVRSHFTALVAESDRRATTPSSRTTAKRATTKRRTPTKKTQKR